MSLARRSRRLVGFCSACCQVPALSHHLLSEGVGDHRLLALPTFGIGKQFIALVDEPALAAREEFQTLSLLCGHRGAHTTPRWLPEARATRRC